MELTQDCLKSILNYNEETGVFTWIKPKKGRRKIAGGMRKDGYFRICINYKRYLSHRLAWLYYYGEFPKHQIDHIDQNPSNNAISNLRDIKSQNVNFPKAKNNTSGFTGVSYSKKDRVWVSKVQVKGHTHYLGSYNTVEEANEESIKFRLKNGFHINHGKEKVK